MASRGDELMKYAAMIPVRKGSERLPIKNYLTLGSERIFEHTILKTKKTGLFEYIFLNTEDSELRSVSEQHEIGFHLRQPHLASSSASSDAVVLDALNHLAPDFQYLIWINTASPLTTLDDIRAAVDLCKRREPRSFVSTRLTRGHLSYKDQPLNFSFSGGFQRTQELTPAHEFNYALMGWHRDCTQALSAGILFDKDTCFLETSWWSNQLLKKPSDYEVIKQLYTLTKEG
jgi:CMP-N-acetylneuraminic acid synthetase